MGQHTQILSYIENPPLSSNINSFPFPYSSSILSDTSGNQYKATGNPSVLDLGSSKYTLQANTRYWLVMEFRYAAGSSCWGGSGGNGGSMTSASGLGPKQSVDGSTWTNLVNLGANYDEGSVSSIGLYAIDSD